MPRATIISIGFTNLHQDTSTFCNQTALRHSHLEWGKRHDVEWGLRFVGFIDFTKAVASDNEFYDGTSKISLHDIAESFSKRDASPAGEQSGIASLRVTWFLREWLGRVSVADDDPECDFLLQVAAKASSSGGARQIYMRNIQEFANFQLIPRCSPENRALEIALQVHVSSTSSSRGGRARAVGPCRRRAASCGGSAASARMNVNLDSRRPVSCNSQELHGRR